MNRSLAHNRRGGLGLRSGSAVGALSWVLGLILSASLTGCSSTILKADNANEILANKEFEKALDVKELPPEEALGEPAAPEAPASGASANASTDKAPANKVEATKTPAAPPPGDRPEKIAAKKAVVKAVVQSKATKSSKRKVVNAADVKQEKAAIPLPREPNIEDSEGFDGRRPVVDPFRVGEKVTLEVSYFAVVAGDMTLETRPFVEVNGRRSYRFAGTARSTSVFAMFYAVDDWFETFVDYETLVPYSYALHVKESKQLRETRSLFDWTNLKASYWDKKINSEKKVEEKKMEWDISPYSQNVFSAVSYLRTFQLKPGKKIVFRVAHENKNLMVTGDVLRRERISTPAGDFNTVVVKPTIELNGVFKPVGDIFIWLTDDDRKFIVRIESKIKIGKIVGVAKALDRGRE